MTRFPWHSLFLALAGISGAIGVAMGAAGAHALQARLGPDALAWVETGVRYQLWHCLALALVAVLSRPIPGARPSAILVAAGLLFLIGQILFPGALYALAFSGDRGFAHVAPFGGLSLILGWLTLAFYAVATGFRKPRG